MSQELETSVRAPGGPGVTRFASREGHRLSYESSGEIEGAPVLALHDLLADRGQFRPLSTELATAGFRTTLPDARGHGASAMLSGQRVAPAELAADALAVLDAEGLTAVQVVAVGWSAASALALAASGRAISLTLIAPALPALYRDHPHPDAGRYGEALAETIGEAAEAAVKGQVDRALDLFLGVRWGNAWRERLSKPRLGAIRRAAANLGPLLAGLVPEAFDRDALGAINRPVTILLRQDAPAFERWNAEALTLLIPGAGIQNAAVPEDEGSATLPLAWAPSLLRVLERDRG